MSRFEPQRKRISKRGGVLQNLKKNQPGNNFVRHCVSVPNFGSTNYPIFFEAMIYAV
jgi:hypothetical protein